MGAPPVEMGSSIIESAAPMIHSMPMESGGVIEHSSVMPAMPSADPAPGQVFEQPKPTPAPEAPRAEISPSDVPPKTEAKTAPKPEAAPTPMPETPKTSERGPDPFAPAPANNEAPAVPKTEPPAADPFSTPATPPDPFSAPATPAAEAPATEAPATEPAAPATDLFSPPAAASSDAPAATPDAVATPASDPFGAPAAPASDVPAATPGTADPFSAPATEAPAATTELTPSATNVGDLFAAPAATESATPASDAPAADAPAVDTAAPAMPTSDPFGAPPTEAVPPAAAQADPFGAPVTQEAPAADNLFASPAADTSSVTGSEVATEPAATDANPLETTASATVETKTSDLFGTPENVQTGTESATAGEAAAAPGTADLFGPPAAPSEAAPAGAPTSTENHENAAPTHGNELSAESSKPTTVTLQTPEQTQAPVDINSLFGTPPAATADPKPLHPTAASAKPTIENLAESSDMRVWHDNTGTFEVTAKLAVIDADKVRLIKENGRFTTVPLRRLSTADLKYLQSMNSKLSLPANQLLISAGVAN